MAVELATAYVQILPSFRGGQAAIARGITPPATAAGETAGTEAGKKFSGKFALAAKVGLVAAGAGVALFAKGAISAASDVNESQSKVGVVFGKASGQIIAASKASAAAMGLSTGAYLEATGTLGNLLVSLKIAPQAAADMSQQMVKLAGDLASFNNVSPEEALAAIKSGLVGETEPLRAFGVNMNDATLRAQALKLHLIKTTKDALTPQVKALAAQALIMDQTKTAQGDFARTSGGLANQQRILAAQFEDVKAKVGKALLPIMVKLANFLTSKVLPAFQVVSAWVQEHWPEIKDAIVNTWKQYIQPVFGAIATFITEKVIPAVQAVVGFVVQHWPQISSAIVTAWNAIRPTIEAFGKLLQTVWDSVIKPFVAWVQAHWSQISTVVKIVFTAVAVAAAVVVVALRVAFNTVAVLIRLLAAEFRFLYSTASTIFRAIGTVVRTIGSAFSEAYQTAKRWIGNIITAVSELPGKIAGFAGRMVRAGTDLMIGVFDGIKTAVSHAGGFIADLGKDIVNAIIDGLNAILPHKLHIHIPIPAAPDVNLNIPLIPNIPHLALGGDVKAGRSYVVGDGGRPEVFTATENGRIHPSLAAWQASEAGGGGTTTINLVVSAKVLASVLADQQLVNARRS